jgi:hypothetical protein
VALGRLLAQYFLYRLGRKKAPEVQRFYTPGLTALDHLFGWSRKTRVVGAENCLHVGPAIFASNHIEMDDPFVTGNAIFCLSGGAIRPRAMMRDDFFRGMPKWAKTLCDPDEMSRLIGAIQITREHVDASQLAPFVKILCESGVFLIYPGRTRSRSGVFIEYRDWIRSPGATSLFLALAQQECPDLKIPAIPVTRTLHPVTRRGVLVFGEPLYLPMGADRGAQREFDYQLVVAMSDLVEVHVPHVLSAMLYLRRLHGGSDILDLSVAHSAVAEIFENIRNRYTDPAAHRDPEGEIAMTLRFLEKKDLVRRRGRRIELNGPAILTAPASFSRYRAENPVRYSANQILHLRDVVAVIETITIGR